MSTQTRYESYQAADDTGIDETIDNIIADKVYDQRLRDDLEAEAIVRDLAEKAKQSMAGELDVPAEEILEELHYHLRLDEDIDAAVERGTTLLEDKTDLSPAEAKQTRTQFRRQARLRDQAGGRHPDPQREYKTLSKIAIALGYMHAVSDLTPYAEVRMESVDEPGVSDVDKATPVGRRRLPKKSMLDPERAAVEIPHASCDHILGIALPRQGKDSTLASIGLNLWREHNYSYFSILDDGRMETPMLAVPNDDDAIRANLDRLGQKPRPFDAEVFVPAMSGLPDKLPANFRPFSIGIDDLTPHLILRLAGITQSSPTTEARIQRAIDETMQNSQEVTELVSRLKSFAKEMSVTIEWSEVKETGTADDGAVQTKSVNYEVPAEDALREAASQLARLAGEGLIAAPDAATNIEMEELVANNDTATVLCCNFLPEGKESLKYIIMDLWLRLIYRARDNNPRLPRVCLEIREIKNVAPSKPGDVRYKQAIKTLRQTIFFLTTQGGSRRILILGSTQKLNDVYKPVRSNMATKILLRLGEEEIETLDRSYHFSYEQKSQLSEFNIGMGMVIAGGDHYWPVEFRGAPCGLGLGDHHWLDRYGIAWGARVREQETDYWSRKHDAAEWWVHVYDASTHDMDSPPRVGTLYSQWFLLSTDFPDDVTRAQVEGNMELVQETLADRREYEVQSPLQITDMRLDERQQDFHYQAADEETKLTDVRQRYDIPQPIGFWLDKPADTRKRYLEALHVIDEHDDLRSLEDIADHLSYGRNTLKNYTPDGQGLNPCYSKDSEGFYKLTAVGKQALTIDWEVVGEEAEAVKTN